MSEKKPQTSKAPAADHFGLEAYVSQLRRLTKLLGAVTTGGRETKPEFLKQANDAFKLAEQIDWPSLVSALRNGLEVVGKQREVEFQARREKLHRAAQAARVPAEMGARTDRVDIFRLEYEGAVAVVGLGGVPVERVQESDGEKLFNRVRHARAVLDQAPFNREEFFKLLKASYVACRKAASASGEYIPVRELHRELLLERARRSERFRRNPDPRSIEPYPLHQFVFDLARFVREGVACGGERLQTQTPSMRENRDTILIPNLDHPLGSETAAARLAIKPA